MVELASSLSGDYVFIGASIDNIQSEWRVVDSRQPLVPPFVVRPRTTDVRYVVEHSSDLGFVLLVSDASIPNGALISLPRNALQSDPRSWDSDQVLVPHSAQFFIRDFALTAGKYLVVERVRVSTMTDQLLVVNLQDRKRDHVADLGDDTVPRSLSLDVDGQSLTRPVVRISVMDFLTPTRWLELDLVTGQHRQIHQKHGVSGGYNSSMYESRIVWASSRDGRSQIPISIVYRKDREHAVSPLLLYGYSAYGLDDAPFFRGSRLSFLDRGFCYAICHARGSSALGRHWYDDGRKLNKLNSIFDLIDSAQHLGRIGWCDPSKIVLEGASAGGLLVLGAMTQVKKLKRNEIHGFFFFFFFFF